MPFSLLLADADNTLLDFHAAERAAFAALAARFSFTADAGTFAVYHAINQKHWAMLSSGQTTSARLRVARFAEFSAAIGLQADPRQMSDLFVQTLSQQNHLMDGAQDFVRRISAQMPVCLVTNGFAAVQRSRFATSPLRPYLTELFISEEFDHAKPHPQMLFAAMGRFGITDPGRVVMIGDNEATDIAAAVSAGMPSILFTAGAPAPAQTRATTVVQTLREAAAWVLRDGG